MTEKTEMLPHAYTVELPRDAQANNKTLAGPTHRFNNHSTPSVWFGSCDKDSVDMDLNGDITANSRAIHCAICAFPCDLSRFMHVQL
jgi:hypothetical protein